MPARVGVEAREPGDVCRAEQAGLLRAGQDLRVAGDGADRPGRQGVAHLREVPVGDGLDPRHPQTGLGLQRLDGPRGAAAARHHVFDDDGSCARDWLALHERAAGPACLGTHVGERKVEALSDGLRPRNSGVGDGDNVVGTGERRAGRVGERVVDEAAEVRECVEAAALQPQGARGRRASSAHSRLGNCCGAGHGRTSRACGAGTAAGRHGSPG